MNHRRQFIIADLAPTILGAVAICALSRADAAKASKRDFSCQDKPKDGMRCGDCRQFKPSASDTGTCAVVEGDVSASGWCMAYTPREAT